jgi:hypothetical protein
VKETIMNVDYKILALIAFGINILVLVRGGLWLKRRAAGRSEGWRGAYESMVATGMFVGALLGVAMCCILLFTWNV